MNFRSDNTTGVSPEILAAIAAANEGQEAAYGDEAITGRLADRFRALFETELAVLPVATGTAANAISLAALTPPYGAIYCHREAHIEVDECGAPELFTGGAKLVVLDGPDGKFDAATLADALARAGAGDVHRVQPAAVGITQASECGTLHAIDEIVAIAEVAHDHGLMLHMDGARFANAVAALGCSPAEATWRAGVDVLSFGATKNGALAAEAIVSFRPDLARELAFRRKRGGHLFSKMRFLSAQLEAYVSDDLWLRNARHANHCARLLADGLGEVPGAALTHPVEANEVFPRLPEAVIKGLLAAGFSFYRWGGEGSTTLRLVTAFNTREEDVAAFVATAKGLAEAAA